VQVNIHTAKTNLSRLIEKVQSGEEVIIAKSGKPVAKLMPIRTTRKRVFESPRPVASFSTRAGIRRMAKGIEGFPRLVKALLNARMSSCGCIGGRIIPAYRAARQVVRR
jgi:prevent-host-death family protein